MGSFKDFFNKIEVIEIVFDVEVILEHQQYKKIPKTQNTYRIDKANTATLTQDHAHVYASKNNQIYSVNKDGSGHDGYSGYEIPKKHAVYFRSIGFEIALNNILESIDLNIIDSYFKVYKIIDNY